MIDLHMHSTFSDGSYTPTELVSIADEKGLTAIALTDHDSMAGLPELFSAIESSSVAGVSGVEISANVEKGTMHMLGYFVDRDNEELEESLRRIRNGREIRNMEILEKLNNAGCQMTWDEVKDRAGEDVVGRPHFAFIMKDKGYVKNTKEAFNRFLARGKKAYADRFRLTPEDSVKVIKAAGGVPVLAHPFTLDLSDTKLLAFLKDASEMGLQGVEVYYPEHPKSVVDKYLSMARECGLIVTGGSDFHGEINPKIEMGRGFGSLNVPDKIVQNLLTCREGDVSSIRDGEWV